MTFVLLKLQTPHFQWRVGRILQFSYFKERTKRAPQYSSEVVEISGIIARIGVICSWYNFLCSSQSLQENLNLQITWGNKDHHSITLYQITYAHCHKVALKWKRIKTAQQQALKLTVL